MGKGGRGRLQITVVAEETVLPAPLEKRRNVTPILIYQTSLRELKYSARATNAHIQNKIGNSHFNTSFSSLTY